MAAWPRVERAQTVVALILGVLALISGMVTFLSWFGVSTPKEIVKDFVTEPNPQTHAASTTSPQAASPPKVVASQPRPSSRTSMAPPSPTSSGLLINLSIQSVYSRGKDKAAACHEERLFCLAVDDVVLGDDGELRSGCHLSWRLYTGTSSVLLDKDNILYCGVDPIFAGHKIPMPAGLYRLEVHVELDDGTTGSTAYRFSLVD